MQPGFHTDWFFRRLLSVATRIAEGPWRHLQPDMAATVKSVTLSLESREVSLEEIRQIMYLLTLGRAIWLQADGDEIARSD